MSGTQKPHFAVDLNEIERQLAQAQSAAPSPFSSGGRHDPLADLARIGGQDDPFEALLSNERTRGAPPQSRASRFSRSAAVRAGISYGAPGAREPAPHDFDDTFEPEAPARAIGLRVSAAGCC